MKEDGEKGVKGGSGDCYQPGDAPRTFGNTKSNYKKVQYQEKKNKTPPKGRKQAEALSSRINKQRMRNLSWILLYLCYEHVSEGGGNGPRRWRG